MSSMELAQRYFDAWNAQDAAAIVATFAPGGTYEDPTTSGPLAGEAIGAYAAGLWGAFPDLHFEVISAAPAGEGMVAAQWIMRGVNDGSMFGLPPTGKTVELGGADFIVVEEEGIRSMTGYFDAGVLPRQLGLQVIVQPYQLDQFSFGTSNALQIGNPATLGALAFTCLFAANEDEVNRVNAMAEQIAMEMPQLPGFISLTNIDTGHRLMTLSAWETPEQPRQMMQGGLHVDAMREFYNDGYYIAGFTSVWEPSRITFVARCQACGKMHRQNSPITQCSCGAPLSMPHNTW